MEKIKKLTILLTLCLLSITNFSYIFADEDENNNDDIKQTEIIVNYENQKQLNNIENNINNISKSLNDIITSENQAQLNNIQSDIGDIKDEIKEIKPILTAIGNIPRPMAINFDLLNNNELNYLYDNYNNINYALGSASVANGPITNLYIPINPIVNDNGSVYFGECIAINSSGNQRTVILDYNYYLTLDNYSDKFYKFGNNVLNPFKLNIVNNGLGNITNSVNIEPYVSTNIYYDGQSITLTYDNSNDDFNGWYKNGVYVSNNLSYTFNIDTDTTIEINKYIEPIESNTYTMVLTCIFVCCLFMMFKSLIWGV